MPDVFHAHLLIREAGLPNYLGCHIPVQGQLNAWKWQSYLSDYWDQQLTDLITYGFPLDFNGGCDLSSACENHKSAIDFPEQIEDYITTTES